MHECPNPADDERPACARAINVQPAGGAVAGRGVRHGVDLAAPLFRVPAPGTSIAPPQEPFRSLSTNAWYHLHVTCAPGGYVL